jgi:NAD(P)-dependent dehydrogenase (short-subunit alcohol dehydrogenase family)
MVKQILEKIKPQHLFATCRNPSGAKELNDLASHYGNLHVIELDLGNEDKYTEVVDKVDAMTGGEGLNVLINNSGIYGDKGVSSIFNLDKKQLQEHFDVNTFAPVFLTKAFVPLLEKASSKGGSAPNGIGRAVVMNISTKMASITDNTSGGAFCYRSSKTALNMLTKCMSFDLKAKGIVTVLMHPGWVRTDMGGPNGLLSTDESANGILNVLENIGEDDNGKFLQFDGQQIAW